MALRAKGEYLRNECPAQAETQRAPACPFQTPFHGLYPAWEQAAAPSRLPLKLAHRMRFLTYRIHWNWLTKQRLINMPMYSLNAASTAISPGGFSGSASIARRSVWSLSDCDAPLYFKRTAAFSAAGVARGHVDHARFPWMIAADAKVFIRHGKQNVEEAALRNHGSGGCQPRKRHIWTVKVKSTLGAEKMKQQPLGNLAFLGDCIGADLRKGAGCKRSYACRKDFFALFHWQALKGFDGHGYASL